jgi:hypothetical protein
MDATNRALPGLEVTQAPRYHDFPDGADWSSTGRYVNRQNDRCSAEPGTASHSANRQNAEEEGVVPPTGVSTHPAFPESSDPDSHRLASPLEYALGARSDSN